MGILSTLVIRRLFYVAGILLLGGCGALKPYPSELVPGGVAAIVRELEVSSGLEVVSDEPAVVAQITVCRSGKSFTIEAEKSLEKLGFLCSQSDGVVNFISPEAGKLTSNPLDFYIATYSFHGSSGDCESRLRFLIPNSFKITTDDDQFIGPGKSITIDLRNRTIRELLNHFAARTNQSWIVTFYHRDDGTLAAMVDFYRRPVRDFSGWKSSKPLQINCDRGYRASLDESAAYDTERYDLGTIRLPASLSAALQHFSPPRLPRPTAGEARGRKMRHKQGVPTKIPEQPYRKADKLSRVVLRDGDN